MHISFEWTVNEKLKVCLFQHLTPMIFFQKIHLCLKMQFWMRYLFLFYFLWFSSHWLWSVQWKKSQSYWKNLHLCELFILISHNWLRNMVIMWKCILWRLTMVTYWNYIVSPAVQNHRRDRAKKYACWCMAYFFHPWLFWFLDQITL